MADKMIENNQVVIMGEIVSPFTFSHQVFGEGFYLVDVMVKRLSESQDIIPVMVSGGWWTYHRITRVSGSASAVSSGPTTATRRRRTVWYSPYLRGN